MAISFSHHCLENAFSAGLNNRSLAALLSFPRSLSSTPIEERESGFRISPAGQFILKNQKMAFLGFRM
jgi:hypothetical protein